MFSLVLSSAREPPTENTHILAQRTQETERERDVEKQVAREENEMGEKQYLKIAATKGYSQPIKGAGKQKQTH